MGIAVLGLINLCLYCAQQLGVALGLGAQTIMLVSYVSATRDGVIDDTEAQFLRATRAVLWVALALMILSGVAISLLHFTAGQGATVFTPAYLFKSALIVLVLVLTALLHTLPETFAEGLLGGTWYALFLVHILAPVTSWANLLMLYVIWLAGFNLIWYAIVFSTREKKVVAEKPKEKPTAPKAPEVPKAIEAPKTPRKPLFSFSFFTKHASKAKKPEAEAGVLVPAIIPAHIAPPVLPAPAPQIKLDPVPKVPPAMPLSELKTIMQTPEPLARKDEPVEKMPGSIATDTPFLPQVPPLQPIPTIPPVQGLASTAAALTAAASNAITPAPSVPPAPEIAPEIKLGLNVMPKAPGQLSK